MDSVSGLDNRFRGRFHLSRPQIVCFLLCRGAVRKGYPVAVGA